MSSAKKWLAVALGGMMAGAGCCGGAPEAAVPAAPADPAATAGGQADKDGCKGAPGEKHECGAGHGAPAPQPPK